MSLKALYSFTGGMTVRGAVAINSNRLYFNEIQVLKIFTLLSSVQTKEDCRSSVLEKYNLSLPKIWISC